MSVSRWRDSTDCLCSLEMECSAGCNTRIAGGRLGMLSNTATSEALGQCGMRMYVSVVHEARSQWLPWQTRFIRNHLPLNNSYFYWEAHL